MPNDSDKELLTQFRTLRYRPIFLKRTVTSRKPHELTRGAISPLSIPNRPLKAALDLLHRLRRLIVLQNPTEKR